MKNKQSGVQVSGTISLCALTSARLRWWSPEEDWWGDLWGSGPPGQPWGGQTGNSHTGPLFSSERTCEALTSKRAFKEERFNSKMTARDCERGESQLEQRATHSFLSRAFSSSLVNKLFSPICIENKQCDISHTLIFYSISWYRFIKHRYLW